jgi:two-component system, chemotaxis family, protein-glutamate methylesterase/glutaminase
VIRVLIVDDSALIRGLMKEIVSAQPDMEAVGVAPDPIVARDMIKQLNPDVLTLDVEMPRMNGLEFLEKLMRLRPMPVVMVSTLTEQGSEVTLKALELGAVDFVSKPRLGVSEGMQEIAEDIADKIRAAARARIRSLNNRSAVPARASLSVGQFSATNKLIIIGASTGGTEAIKETLIPLPTNCPPILITQHMPEGFTVSFARRLDSTCAMTVKEASHGERVLPGHAYIAPGHSHLLLKKNGAHYYAELSQGPPVNRHRPSVDVLFDSAALAAGRNAVGVILTGMGKDGAAGMLALRNSGAWTIGQDEASCVVYGMPKAAFDMGGVQEVASLSDIPARIMAKLAGK